MSQFKAYILDRFANENSNYTCWLDDCSVPWEIVEEYTADWIVPDDAGIVVTHQHYRWEEIHLLRKILTANRHPILILADGVLEYRNTWENPKIADGAIFQPVVGHKLACIGRSQARVVESWGNVGKAEIVGLPRFDNAASEDCLPVQTAGPFRILVATARTPAFTDGQREWVTRSLQDLKSRLEKNPWVNGRPVEVHWRLTDRLETDIELATTDTSQSKIALSDLMEQVDAVITTPSTVYLESVLKRRPTAVLDYHNAPQYLSPAWSISAPSHIDHILSELAAPPESKLQFQRAVLHDQLECESPAKPRLLSLINTMIEIGAEARATQQELVFPNRILADSQRGFSFVESEWDPSVLYPNNSAFKQTDDRSLRVELNHAIARLGQLPAELDTKNADIVRKTKHIADMSLRLEDAGVRIAKDREHRAQLQAIIEQKTSDLARKDEHIQSLEKLVQTTREREQEIIERKKVEMSRKTQHIENLDSVINTSRERIQELEVELEKQSKLFYWLKKKIQRS